jgi:hypothetical protein
MIRGNTGKQGARVAPDAITNYELKIKYKYSNKAPLGVWGKK